MLRLPAWLAFVLFVPLQVWVFLELRDAWGIWRTIAAFALLGLLAARAARPSWLQRWLFPARAQRKERRRPVYSVLLLALGAVALLAPYGPQPWLPAASLVFVAKANLS